MSQERSLDAWTDRPTKRASGRTTRRRQWDGDDTWQPVKASSQRAMQLNRTATLGLTAQLNSVASDGCAWGSFATTCNTNRRLSQVHGNLKLAPDVASRCTSVIHSCEHFAVSLLKASDPIEPASSVRFLYFAPLTAREGSCYDLQRVKAGSRNISQYNGELIAATCDGYHTATQPNSSIQFSCIARCEETLTQMVGSLVGRSA